MSTFTRSTATGTYGMIAGLVATLKDDAGILASALAAFDSHPAITLGEFRQNDRRIPLLIESPLRSDVERLTEWMRSQQGVAFVDVVYVHFEETDEAPKGNPELVRSSAFRAQKRD